MTATEAPRKRPPVDPATYELVLRKVAAGKSVKRACKDLRAKGLRAPSPPQFLAWAFKTPEQSDRYIRAKRQGIELRVDGIFDMIDACDQGVTDGPSLQAATAKARLQVDTVKWVACKLVPRLYGDHVQHEHKGSVSIVLATGVERALGEVTETTARIVADATEEGQLALAAGLGRALPPCLDDADELASEGKAASMVTLASERGENAQDCGGLLD